MSLGIILTITSLAVAAIASIVGIWVERDPRRAKTIAYVLSGLIIMASAVSMAILTALAMMMRPDKT